MHQTIFIPFPFLDFSCNNRHTVSSFHGSNYKNANLAITLPRLKFFKKSSVESQSFRKYDDKGCSVSGNTSGCNRSFMNTD